MSGSPVYLEVGSKKVFASAVDWPGWCRCAKSEEAALAALADYHGRYAEVADQAGLRFPESVTFEVVERLPGDMTTNFGAPGAVAAGDADPLTAAAAKRTAALVGAAWQVLDKIAAVTPDELRKGPRGGGRDRDKMLDHVLGAEAAFARKVGVRHKAPALTDATAIEAMRADLLAVFGAPSDGTAPVGKGWPLRYAARRIAWHALDHAWEMQDRSD
jgi:hypothetical protein